MELLHGKYETADFYGDVDSSARYLLEQSLRSAEQSEHIYEAIKDAVRASAVTVQEERDNHINDTDVAHVLANVLEELVGRALEPKQKPESVYCLCEEYEGDDGIREFRILGVSQDKEALRNHMKAIIKSDPYGFVAENGIDTDSDDYFCTKFEAGFVEYSIKEEKVLSRAELAEKTKAIPVPDEKETDQEISYTTVITPEGIEFCCYIDDLEAYEHDGVVEVDVDDVEGSGALFNRLLEYLEAMEYDIDLTKTEFFVTYEISSREVALTCDFDWSDDTGIDFGESSQNLLMPHEQAIVLEALDNWSQSNGFASFEEQVAVQIEGKKPSLAGRIGAAEAKATVSHDDTRDVPEKGSDAR